MIGVVAGLYSYTLMVFVVITGCFVWVGWVFGGVLFCLLFG